MKRIMIVMLALALSAVGAVAVATGDAGAFLGTWGAYRATMTIEEAADGTIRCQVYWPSSAAEATEWVYENCVYDEATGELTTPETGVKTNLTFAEDGEVAARAVVFEDGAARFALNDDGTLTWTDYREPSGENTFVFERASDEIHAVLGADAPPLG